ncbi:hypothetical protein C8F01DRAFT_1156659 [Mycena amicta]|nr:hypothetical protein C8F01DRAFT_1156659 [Mycena amicta]
MSFYPMARTGAHWAQIPPPTPRPNRTTVSTFRIHPALSRTSAMQFDIDFSLPDVAFKSALSQLGETVLRAPACNPPRNSVHLRVASGAYKMRIHVTGYEGAVTVSDVLRKLHRTLRERHYDADSSARAYTARRSQNNDEEPETRMVDRLLGHTLFAGAVAIDGEPEHWWQVELAVPESYQY